MQVRSNRVEMSVILLVDRRRRRLPHRVELVGHHRRQLDVGHVGRERDFLAQFLIRAWTPFDFSRSFPDIADRRGNDNRRRSLGPRVRDILPHIPAKGMHGLRLMGGDVHHRLRLFAQARQRVAPALDIQSAAVVVVAKLNQHQVARFHLGKETSPGALGVIAARTPSAPGTIGHVDLGRIEVVGKRDRPALLSRASTAGGCRVSRHEEGRQGGIEDGADRGGIVRQIGRVLRSRDHTQQQNEGD